MHIKYYRLEATKCFYHLNTYKTTIKLSLQYVLQHRLQVTTCDEHIPCIWLVGGTKGQLQPTGPLPSVSGGRLRSSIDTKHRVVVLI